MSFSWKTRIPERVANAQPYVPGEQKNEGGWIKLNTNELPYPPSPRVAEAVAEAASRLRLYPDPSGTPVREAIAGRFDIRPEQVMLGNGCDDILNVCVRTFTEAGDPVGYLDPSYSLYKNLIINHGARLAPISYGPGFAFPMERFASTPVKMLILTSPNAPSGVAFSSDQLASVLEKTECPTIIDETYADFSTWTAIDLISKYPQLLVARSFSKTYGLAGLRFGYLIGSSEVMPYLHRIRDVYNVDRLAQAGALVAFLDTGYYKEKHTELKNTRNRFSEILEHEFGWTVYPSSTNFVFTIPKDKQGNESPAFARALYTFLVEHRILVRYFDNHPLVSSGLRISIGTPAEIEKLTQILLQWKRQDKPAS